MSVEAGQAQGGWVEHRRMHATVLLPTSRIPASCLYISLSSPSPPCSRVCPCQCVGTSLSTPSTMTQPPMRYWTLWAGWQTHRRAPYASQRCVHPLGRHSRPAARVCLWHGAGGGLLPKPSSVSMQGRGAADRTLVLHIDGSSWDVCAFLTLPAACSSKPDAQRSRPCSAAPTSRHRMMCGG